MYVMIIFSVMKVTALGIKLRHWHLLLSPVNVQVKGRLVTAARETSATSQLELGHKYPSSVPPALAAVIGKPAHCTAAGRHSLRPAGTLPCGLCPKGGCS